MFINKVKELISFFKRRWNFSKLNQSTFINSLLFSLPTKKNIKGEENFKRKAYLLWLHKESDFLSTVMVVPENNIITNLIAFAYWDIPMPEVSWKILKDIMENERPTSRILYHYLDYDVITKAQFYERFPSPKGRSDFIDKTNVPLQFDAFNYRPTGRIPVDYSNHEDKNSLIPSYVPTT